MSFWDVVWFIIIAYAFVAFLMVMFAIVTDLFRNHEMSGFVKAVWIFCLIFFTLIAALVYLIVNGKGMAERSTRSARSVQEQQDAYIRNVAGQASPADQIAQAKSMLDSGAISPAEFETLKSKALA